MDEILRLACDMQDRIGLIRIFLERLDRFCCRKYDQFDFAASGFALHLVHNRQGSRPRADNQPPALPGDILLSRERRVPKGSPKPFGRLLIPFADVAPIDDNVAIIGRSIDTDRPKGKSLENQNPFARSPLPLTARLAHKSSPNLNSINIGSNRLEAT